MYVERRQRLSRQIAVLGVTVVKIDLYRLGEQATPNDESDSSLGIMLVMHREYAYS